MVTRGVPTAVPSPPYGITLLNCDGHAMTLGWKVPRFSGGTPVLGYFVDKREAQHRNWHEVNAAPVKERLLTVGVGFVGSAGCTWQPGPSPWAEHGDKPGFHTTAPGAVGRGSGAGRVSGRFLSF